MKKMSILLCALCLAAVASHAEVVNFMFQGNPDFAAFASDGIGPFTATGISGIANGEAFTFDLTVSAVSGNGDGHIDFNKQDIMFDADSGQNKANSLTLTISNMQLAAGQTYGGIEGVTKYDNGGGDDWDIAGQTISGVDQSDTTLTSPILGAMTINAIDNAPGANGPSKLRGISLEITLDSTAEVAPVITDFTANNTYVLPGTTATLSWDVLLADSLVIDQGVGDVTATNAVDVTVNTDTLYTLIATNAYGASTGTVSVTTRPLPSSGPNVVFVLVDDWGWTHHSDTNAAMGHQSLYFETPNFERLVDAGVAFTSAYAQPNCAPTRACLMTGEYSCRTGNGVYNVSSLNRAGSLTTYTTPANQGDEHINGDEQTITIAESFVNSGYVTAHFGKYHVGSSTLTDPTAVLNQGFDYNYGGSNAGNPGTYFASGGAFASKLGPGLEPFAGDYDLSYISNNLIPYANGNDPTTLVGTKKHLTDAMADAFVSFMNDHQSGSLSNYPVYAQVHFYAVHKPLQPRSDLKAKYDGITPPPESAQTNASYAALIEGMDQSLGRIIDYLNDPNGDGNPVDSIATNTLLVFCSDNGGAETNAPLRAKKGTHFQGGIRVPCVVSMPGTIPTNTVSDTLIHVVDFYPTMLDFAGGVYPNSTTHPLDGVSLHDHLLDPDHVARNRGPIFYHFPGYMDTRAYACSMVIKDVGGKRYKYIYSYDPYYEPSAAYDQFQLYNLTDDISETTNLLDYIDLENTGDPADPSTSEEYWNYILYKDIANELAADLNAWLVGDPGDTTWNPIHVTYKDIYPGIAPEQVGQEVEPAPASIPELEIQEDQVFQVLHGDVDIVSGELTMKFNSEAGYNYAIQASSNLVDWVDIDADIVGQAGSTTRIVSDAVLSSDSKRFYRAILTGE